MERTLDLIIKRYPQSTFVIYGTGDMARQLFDHLQKNNINIPFFLNTCAEKNQQFMDKPVISLADLSAEKTANTVFLLASNANAISMKQNLISHGIDENNIFHFNDWLSDESVDQIRTMDAALLNTISQFNKKQLENIVIIVSDNKSKTFLLKNLLNIKYRIKEKLTYSMEDQKKISDFHDYTEYEYLIVDDYSFTEYQLVMQDVPYSHIHLLDENSTFFGRAAIKKLICEYDFNTILDIGCGAGYHSDLFTHFGKKVTAIDYGESIYFKQKKQEIKTIVDDFNTHDFAGQTYDAVWCCHVLEHQLNVHSFLLKIHSLLKETGILAITVPPLKHEIVGGHVCLWNSGLLLYHLVLAGFNCNKAIVKKYGYNISAIVQKESINVIPLLNYDAGDIQTLSPYLPKDIPYKKTPVDTPFDGDIHQINWETD